LTIEALANLPIAAPPEADERSKINGAVMMAFEKFTPLIKEAETAIQLLNERRSALISAAVTGKIDVRERVLQQVAAE
jgi:type I restriction enzyme S subunit